MEMFAQMYCCVFTSMTPRVVMRSVGMTGSAMKLSVMKGSMPRLTPRQNAASFAASSYSFILVSGSSDIMPAISRTTLDRTFPSLTTTMPPWFSTM